MDIDILKKCYDDFLSNLTHYEDINRYYWGNFKEGTILNAIPGKSINIKTNFIQKLVDEEARYSFGNPITYTSKDDNEQVIKDIDYYLQANKEDHDIILGETLIKFGAAFEINYLDKYKKFKNKIIDPLEGYMYFDEYGEPLFFMRIFTKSFSDKVYIDVYDDKYIYHYDNKFNELISPTSHYFGVVPVGFGTIGGKVYTEERGYVEGDKTIYRTIKTIQDAFEENISDMATEISEIKNAILKMFGIELEDEVDEKGNVVIDEKGEPKKRQPVIKNNSILYFGDKKIEDAEWLIKNINDTFIKNTRDELKDLIYTLTSHVDQNQKMQSNISGMALRTRMNSLENKCVDNEKALSSILRTRLICLFRYLDVKESKVYDPGLIKIEFTPKIPVDDVATADIISKIPQEVVSNETKRSWISKINNPVAEGEKIKKELLEQKPIEDLDNLGAGIDE
ncbi:MAG: phage portal protein [Filifactoraceae bacterium]